MTAAPEAQSGAQFAKAGCGLSNPADTMDQASTAEVVSDPVAHISISGVHGRGELNERLAHMPRHHNGNQRAMLGAVVVGAVVGAALMYLFNRD